MSDDAPLLSIVVSTLARKGELQRLLSSLEKQTFQDFEVIVVDQNPDSLIMSVVEEANGGASVRRLHTPNEKGLSRGRNRGLALARGKYLLFPDDDCWYPPGFLERAVGVLGQNDLDAVTGRPTSVDGRPIHGRFETNAQAIERSNVWTTQIEWIAFWRRALIEGLGGFDEAIGIGAPTPWQSAEGQDLMLRALCAGARCWYDPDLNGHDDGFDRRKADAVFIAKARAYGRGMGHVIRKQRCGPRVALYFLARSIGGSAVALVTGELPLARFHLATAVGRFEGIVGRCFPSARR
jgi:glycosyltransferase involved in cell wall biosynthesis